MCWDRAGRLASVDREDLRAAPALVDSGDHPTRRPDPPRRGNRTGSAGVMATVAVKTALGMVSAGAQPSLIEKASTVRVVPASVDVQ